MPKPVVTDLQIFGLVAAAQKLIDDDRATLPRLPPISLTLMPGRRYWRVVRQQSDGHGQRFVYAFIDLSNGCLLRPAGWKKPNPIPRGHLFDPIDPSHGRSALTPHGIRYIEDRKLDPLMVDQLRRKYAPETLPAGSSGPLPPKFYVEGVHRGARVTERRAAVVTARNPHLAATQFAEDHPGFVGITVWADFNAAASAARREDPPAQPLFVLDA
jgi:hypothetical protein